MSIISLQPVVRISKSDFKNARQDGVGLMHLTLVLSAQHPAIDAAKDERITPVHAVHAPTTANEAGS